MDSLTTGIPRKPKAFRFRDNVDVIKRQMSELIVQCPDELHTGLLLNMNSLIEACYTLGKEHGKQEMARSIMAHIGKELDDTVA